MLIRILAIIVCAAGLARAGVVTSISDIQNWVGSGTNEAVMVVDWSDGKSPVSLAWGFRWDGVATGLDMMEAIAATDPRFSLVLNPDFPTTVFGLFYDVDGTGGTFTPGAPGVFPGADTPGTLSDPNDHYENGWSSAFWEYYCFGGSFDYQIGTDEDGNPIAGPNSFAGASTYPGTDGNPDWRSSFTGASDRELSNGSWDAWSYDPGFVSQPIDVPVAAVPEPHTLGLISLFAGFLLWRFGRGSWRTRLQNSAN